MLIKYIKYELLKSILKLPNKPKVEFPIPFHNFTDHQRLTGMHGQLTGRFRKVQPLRKLIFISQNVNPNLILTLVRGYIHTHIKYDLIK